MTRWLVGQGVFAQHVFSLADVGASGGIENHWRVFGDALIAHGFEPLVGEAKRLNAAEHSAHVTYHALKVVGPPPADGEPAFGADQIALRDNQPFARTSAARAMSLLRLNYTRSVYDPDGTGDMTDQETTLDEFFLAQGGRSVDFIKIDTDGHDYQVLQGAEHLIEHTPLLGLFVESQFHGAVHPRANLFCNIDQLLRAKGYSLFDLEVYRYSRATLPKPFALRLTAQTHEGQVLWGDALYLRDVGSSDYEKMWGMNLGPHQILKLACVFELYGLEDCAAELLCRKREALGAVVNVNRCLDLLTPRLRGKESTFWEYQSAFEKDPNAWFPTLLDRSMGGSWRDRLTRLLQRFGRG